jgi:hypothetical protein
MERGKSVSLPGFFLEYESPEEEQRSKHIVDKVLLGYKSIEKIMRMIPPEDDKNFAKMANFAVAIPPQIRKLIKAVTGSLTSANNESEAFRLLYYLGFVESINKSTNPNIKQYINKNTVVINGKMMNVRPTNSSVN